MYFSQSRVHYIPPCYYYNYYTLLVSYRNMKLKAILVKWYIKLLLLTVTVQRLSALEMLLFTCLFNGGERGLMTGNNAIPLLVNIIIIIVSFTWTEYYIVCTCIFNKIKILFLIQSYYLAALQDSSYCY